MNFQIVKTDQNIDVDAIREVYYQTWVYSYVGLVPQGLLDNIDKKTTWHPENRLNNTLVAIVDQKVVGVCTYGPARRNRYQNYGEIYSIYVLPNFQHKGIGKKLFQKALDILEKNFDALYLIVLRDNLPSRAFYEMFGFEPTDDLIADQTEFGILHEIVYIK